MKKQRKRIILLAITVVLIAIVGIYFFIRYQTYNYMKILETYENNTTDNAQYTYCSAGVIQYSRDGVALLTKNGKEVWNQPVQMSNPMVDVCGNSIAVGDKGGTSIFVFQKKGLRGEIHTTRPIQNLAVSSQGIVSAILKDEETPLVMCYDAKGNVLIEHKASIKNMGYPIAVAISENGNTLLVSYLNAKGNSLSTKVVYYYFGENTSEEDHRVLEQEFKNTIVPVTAFLDKEVSLLVADNALVFYEGLQKPQQTARVEVKKEILSVAYNKETIAVLLKKESGGCTLETYDTKGKMLASVGLEKQYTNMKVEEDKIVMYDGQLCSIYIKNGIHKYEGKSDDKILEIFPMTGLNTYMVINASNFQEVRLAK